MHKVQKNKKIKRSLSCHRMLYFLFSICSMSYNLSITTECVEPFLGPTLGQSCPGSQFLMFMSLVDTFVRAKQDISFLCERVKPIDPPEYTYDFIVVGGEYVLY